MQTAMSTMKMYTHLCLQSNGRGGTQIIRDTLTQRYRKLGDQQ